MSNESETPMRKHRNTNLENQLSSKSDSKYAPGLFKKTASHQMSGANMAKDEYHRRYTYDEQQPTFPTRLSKKLGVESQNSADQNGIRLSGKTLTPVKNAVGVLE